MPADRTHLVDVPATTPAGRGGSSSRGRGRGGRATRGRGQGRGGGASRRSYNRTANAMSRDRYGGYGGFGGLGRVEYTPYEPPVWRPEVILKFLGNSRTNSDEMDAAVLDAPRQFPIESIYFGPNFSIHDHHLQSLADRPHIMSNLQSLTLGDSDTGSGVHLTELAVQAFLAAAPNLRNLRLNACTNLSDATLVKALELCPLLESVKIAGHDKCTGKVRGSAIRELKKRKTLGLNLKLLTLIDQHIDDQEVREMTNSRKGLAVMLGETGDNDSPLFTWYNGVIADLDI